ncbi:bifunctional riboflavin kinase/FMN adenylyltransferase [Bifidobacterium amazonense]|uniref:Bifunctional riboflavin kinase/FMN adenylyltransferase n=1 Tax=Bifidobacterium amazonense TaxID=2809027 RepID=A0ABS9VST4_9BIFI|nr:riboflavin kinase [Bifidobacterium amazonense]MCH9275147.1 bifunctional riboflavin kinase/FMN adenylyltransferase [Bifidobacterium amazonense]
MNITRLTPDPTGLVAWPTLSTSKKSVVTIGVFDGMHRGHQAVIARTVEIARRFGAFSVVVLFDPRPGMAHRYAAEHDGMDVPEGTPDTQALTGANDRIRMMRDMGVDHVLVVRYTMAFAAKSYRFFLGQMVGKLGMRALVLGSDAAMGKDRAGDVKAIANLAAATGVFELEVVDDAGPGNVRIPVDAQPHMPVEWGEPADPLAGLTKAELRAWSKKHQARLHRIWSSTNVRYLLSQGRIVDANGILGHRHAVEGVVVHGEERGRTIGFPTANLDEGSIVGYLPVDGVYAGWLVDMGPAGAGESSAAAGDDAGTGGTNGTADANGADNAATDRVASDDRARIADGSPWRWPAAISIGTKPTFSEKTGLHERVVESYAITDDWLELYGHRVRVEFAGFLRPQVKFDSADDLVAELGRNVEETKRLTAE